MGLRLLNDLILVQLDPDTNLAGELGLLVRPDSAYEHVFRTAKVLDVGPGRWAEKHGQPLNHRIPVGVEPGDGVLFVRFVADGTKTAQAVQYHLGPDKALLKPSDVLLVFDHQHPPKFGG